MHQETMSPPVREGSRLRLDVGCGGKKRDGFVGLDAFAFEGVDHVVDLEKERLPFGEGEVEEVYSSHFFEHLAHPKNALNELVRVATPGAPFQIWTPFIRCNHAFLPTHLSHWSETLWEHVSMTHADWWFEHVDGVLHVERFHYVLSPGIEQRLGGVPLAFAMQHWFNIVMEMGAIGTVRKGPEFRDKRAFMAAVERPRLTFGGHRDDVRELVAPRDFWKCDAG